jgi:hypothetical protein
MLQHYLPGSFRLAPAKSEKVGTAIILLSFALPRGYRDHQGKDSRRNVVSIFFPYHLKGKFQEREGSINILTRLFSNISRMQYAGCASEDKHLACRWSVQFPNLVC